MKAIEDRFKGQRTAVWRFLQRRIAAGLCDRCGTKTTDTRFSRKLGKLVRKRTCNACLTKAVEKQCREHLYPTKEKS